MKTIVLIAGNAGHGKTTFGDYLNRSMLNLGHTTRLDAYAFTIKSIVNQLIGTSWNLLDADKSIKETTNLLVAGEDTGITIRKGLQSIGEFFRGNFGTRIWANSTRLRALNSDADTTIITDCRHPEEELTWFRDACSDFAKVYTVRIRNTRVPVTRGHPSEDKIADAPDELFDFIIENDRTLIELRTAADNLAHLIVELQSRHS